MPAALPSSNAPSTVPQSVSRPHPPILIGGGGEKKTLRLVAQYADACNLFDTGLGPEGIPRKLDILRGHCEDVGRDYAEIDKTVLARVALSRDGSGSGPGGMPYATVEQTVERFGQLSEAGIDTAILGLADNTDDDTYESSPSWSGRSSRSAPADAGNQPGNQLGHNPCGEIVWSRGASLGMLAPWVTTS